MRPRILSTNLSGEFLHEEGCNITEILNDTAYSPLSIARARVAPGESTDSHKLSGTVEIYYILKGYGKAHVGQEIFKLKPGDALFIPQSAPQSIDNIGDEDLIFLCICTPRFDQDNYQMEKNIQ